MSKGKVIGHYRGQDIFEWIEFEPGIRHTYVGVIDLDGFDLVDVTPDDILLEPGILYRCFRRHREALSRIPQVGPQKNFLQRMSGLKNTFNYPERQMT